MIETIRMNISEVYTEKMKETNHYPVMYREVLEFLDLENKKIVVDCTLGMGSHARKLLEVMNDQAQLIGIDRDQDSLEVAFKKLEPFKDKTTLVKDSFSNLDKVLNYLNLQNVDAFLFDLGVSTYQLSNPLRGFSFLKEGPLDMRMDKDSFLSAYDIVNNLSEGELENIFNKFGEERYSKKIANSLINERKKEPIFTTTQLAQVVMRVVPFQNRRDKIHPATRIFQALRIAVNRELEVLSIGLDKAVSCLSDGGRIAVISFHSLEDRIVKNAFKEYSASGVLKIINKKPLLPSEEEKGENNSSRSAKLRVAEKIGS